MHAYRFLRGFVLVALLTLFGRLAPLCLAQENSIPVPEPPVQAADCPAFSKFPQLPMSVVVGCDKIDSSEVALPLRPDAEGRSREKRVRGPFDSREYHLPQVFSQEQAFDSLIQLAGTAGYFVKYSARPATITGRRGEQWVLINVSSESYDVAVVQDTQESCTPINNAEEISRRMQAGNRAAIYGIQFTSKNQIQGASSGIVEAWLKNKTNQDASSEILEALLKYINQNPTEYFIVECHKFSTKGTEDDDLEITRERAKAVVDWLTTQGVPAEHLQAKPFGRTRPVTDNEEQTEIQCNERVELVKVIK